MSYDGTQRYFCEPNVSARGANVTPLWTSNLRTPPYDHESVHGGPRTILKPRPAPEIVVIGQSKMDFWNLKRTTSRSEACGKLNVSSVILVFGDISRANIPWGNVMWANWASRSALSVIWMRFCGIEDFWDQNRDTSGRLKALFCVSPWKSIFRPEISGKLFLIVDKDHRGSSWSRIGSFSSVLNRKPWFGDEIQVQCARAY